MHIQALIEVHDSQTCSDPVRGKWYNINNQNMYYDEEISQKNTIGDFLWKQWSEYNLSNKLHKEHNFPKK